MGHRRTYRPHMSHREKFRDGAKESRLEVFGGVPPAIRVTCLLFGP